MNRCEPGGSSASSIASTSRPEILLVTPAIQTAGDLPFVPECELVIGLPAHPFDFRLDCRDDIHQGPARPGSSVGPAGKRKPAGRSGDMVQGGRVGQEVLAESSVGCGDLVRPHRAAESRARPRLPLPQDPLGHLAVGSDDELPVPANTGVQGYVSSIFHESCRKADIPRLEIVPHWMYFDRRVRKGIETLDQGDTEQGIQPVLPVLEPPLTGARSVCRSRAGRTEDCAPVVHTHRIPARPGGGRFVNEQGLAFTH